MQLGSPYLTQKCSTMSPENQFISESKGQKPRSRVTKTLSAWVFALFWVLASSSFHDVTTCRAPWKVCYSSAARSSAAADVGPFMVVISICVSWLLSRARTRGGPDCRRTCPAAGAAGAPWRRTLSDCVAARLRESLSPRSRRQMAPARQADVTARHIRDTARPQKCLQPVSLIHRVKWRHSNLWLRYDLHVVGMMSYRAKWWSFVWLFK